MELYRQKSSYPKVNAQENLCGRTHYVDNDTLHFHKSRVISARHVDNGLLFAIVTSDALDYQNTKRGFRFVIFDLFGTVLERTDTENAYRTSAQATKAMWAALNEIDAVTVTRHAVQRRIKQHADEMYAIIHECAKIERAKKESAA